MAVYERNPVTGEETTVAGIQDLSVYESRISDIEEVIPSDATSSNQLVTESDLGTAAAKDFTDTVRPNSHDLVESNAVYSAINNAVSSIYTPRGSLTCAELTSSLLIDENVGNVYEMSDSGTTSALFIQGAGTTISVGDNVGIIKAGQNVYMFNYMGNAFDLTDYQKKADNNLTTTSKSIVGAINEVDGEVGALQTSVSNKLQLYTYEITDKSTDPNGNMPCGYASSLGIPINFKPYIVNNYPCNAFIDQAGMIYVRPLNNTWGINDYGSVANFNLKGTLYCVK